MICSQNIHDVSNKRNIRRFLTNHQSKIIQKVFLFPRVKLDYNIKTLKNKTMKNLVLCYSNLFSNYSWGKMSSILILAIVFKTEKVPEI